jgi:hypothetical protein
VSEYNLYAMLHELRTGTPYRIPPDLEEDYGRSFWSLLPPPLLIPPTSFLSFPPE